MNLTKERPTESGFYYLIYGDNLENITVGRIFITDTIKMVNTIDPLRISSGIVVSSYQVTSYTLQDPTFDNIYFSRIEDINYIQLKSIQDNTVKEKKLKELSLLKEKVQQLEKELQTPAASVVNEGAEETINPATEGSEQR